MRAGLWLAAAALAASAGCSLMVDPAGEDGFLCGADNYCPDGFICDADRGECVRGSAGADAACEAEAEGEGSDRDGEASPDAEPDAAADAAE